MDPILIVVLIGALGGLVKSVLGYVPSPDGFNVVKMIKTVILASLAGSAVVYYTKIVGNPDVVLGLDAYIESFFMSVGAASVLNGSVKAGGKNLT